MDDAGVAETGDQTDAQTQEGSTMDLGRHHDMQIVDGGPPRGGFDSDDGANTPPGNSVDAGGELGGGSADSGLDGVPGGGSRGGIECEEGFGGEATLTNADGQAADVIDVILESSEDGPGYFALGLRVARWTPDTTLLIQIYDAGFAVAEGLFMTLEPSCQEDGLWQLNDLRFNPLPSVEIDDIIELELSVTGEVRSALDDEAIIPIGGTIRLQY